jgi:uncharacterized MnhB-related membrane protein
MTVFVMAHPYLTMCLLVWVICSIVSVITKDREAMVLSLIFSVLIGVAWLVVNNPKV